MSTCVGVRRVLPGVPDPAHHPPQLLANGLDGVGLLRLPEGLELRAAAGELADEFLREGTALDLLENLAHFVLRARVDHPGTPGVVPVLGRVADGVAHPGEATL